VNRLILFGPPGSGKGTEAELITERCGIPQISTGDIFRSNIAAETPLGEQAKSYIARGELVPDKLVTALVADRLMQDDVQAGYLLDGFPRTIPQAESLQEIFDEHGGQLDHVIYLKCERDLLLRRLTSRRVCENCGKVYNTITNPPAQEGECNLCGGRVVQRSDDTEETAAHRLSVYNEQTLPLAEYYAKKGLLREVDGAGTGEEVFARLKAYLAL
jgi:adenylate kinase